MPLPPALAARLAKRGILKKDAHSRQTQRKKFRLFRPEMSAICVTERFQDSIKPHLRNSSNGRKGGSSVRCEFNFGFIFGFQNEKTKRFLPKATTTMMISVESSPEAEEKSV